MAKKNSFKKNTKSQSNKKRNTTTQKRKHKLNFNLFGTKSWLAVGIILISLGLFFGGYSFLNNWLALRNANAFALQDNDVPNNDLPLVSGEPIHINVPSVGISLEVIPGKYNSEAKSWTLTTDKAQWGVITAMPNNKANATFIYAHNRKGVFNTLPKIIEGGEAIVTASNGYKFSYKFVGSKVTKPEDTSIFSYKGKPVLVLQTCTGVWYQDRQLFIFDFQKVGKSL